MNEIMKMFNGANAEDTNSVKRNKASKVFWQSSDSQRPANPLFKQGRLCLVVRNIESVEQHVLLRFGLIFCYPTSVKPTFFPAKNISATGHLEGAVVKMVPDIWSEIVIQMNASDARDVKPGSDIGYLVFAQGAMWKSVQYVPDKLEEVLEDMSDLSDCSEDEV